MKQFSLIGVDGNAFSVMAYTSRAMRVAGFSGEQRAQYTDQATSGDYNELLCLSQEWIDKCNQALGLQDEYDEYDEEELDW